MVRCNLAILLAERGIKITRAAIDTKISRTTLTSLSNNYSQGIQFDTINNLCIYLNTTPDKLISFHPTDFKVRSVIREGVELHDEFEGSLLIDVIENNRTTECYLLTKVTCFYDDLCPFFKIETYVPSKNEHTEVLTKDNDVLLKAIEDLPVPFRQDFSDMIFKSIAKEWPEHKEPQLFSLSLPK